MWGNPENCNKLSGCLEQGALEKSLQSSVAFERQKNMDNRVGIIRGSVQVTQTPLRNNLSPDVTKILTNICLKLMDQVVKCIEDMQDDFDFCYKTLQSRGCIFLQMIQTSMSSFKVVWLSSFSNFLQILQQTWQKEFICNFKRFVLFRLSRQNVWDDETGSDAAAGNAQRAWL